MNDSNELVSSFLECYCLLSSLGIIAFQPRRLCCQSFVVHSSCYNLSTPFFSPSFCNHKAVSVRHGTVIGSNVSGLVFLGPCFWRFWTQPRFAVFFFFFLLCRPVRSICLELIQAFGQVLTQFNLFNMPVLKVHSQPPSSCICPTNRCGPLHGCFPSPLTAICIKATFATGLAGLAAPTLRRVASPRAQYLHTHTCSARDRISSCYPMLFFLRPRLREDNDNNVKTRAA